MSSQNSLLQSLSLLAGDLRALTAALIEKGIVTQEETAKHYPKTEAELRAVYDRYVRPFIGEA